MTTTDPNGIQFLQDTDNIAPFQTLINGLQTATSTAVEKAGRAPLYAADTTARAALYAQHSASPTSPLWVDMAGTEYRTTDGSNWTVFPPKTWASGTASFATDASGRYTFNHGLSGTPTSVVTSIYRPGCASDAIAQVAGEVVWAVSATTVTMQFYRRDTQAIFTANTIGVTWWATL